MFSSVLSHFYFAIPCFCGFRERKGPSSGDDGDGSRLWFTSYRSYSSLISVEQSNLGKKGFIVYNSRSQCLAEEKSKHELKQLATSAAESREKTRDPGLPAHIQLSPVLLTLGHPSLGNHATQFLHQLIMKRISQKK